MSDPSESDAERKAAPETESGLRRGFARWANRRFAAMVAVAFCATCSGAFVSDELFMHGLPRGTRAFGIDLSHAEPMNGARALAAPVAARMQRALTVEVDGKSAEVSPGAAGLRIDVSSSLSRVLAARRELSPPRRLLVWGQSLLGALPELELSVAVDEGALQAKLSELERVSVELPFAGGFRSEQGRLLPDYPRAGRRLERKAARTRLTEALAAGERRVVLPTVAVAAPVERVAIDRLVQSATALASAEVTLLEPETSRRLSLAPTALSRALRVAPPEGLGRAPELRLDGEELLRSLGDRRAEVEQDAKSARFEIDAKDRVQIVPSQPELRLSPSGLAEAALRAARAPERSAPLLLERRSEPELSSEQAAQLSIRGLVSTFTTRHPCCERRVQNIHRIADLLDGLLIKPGETVSVNAVVGPRTTKNGFVPAPTIEEGEMVESIGGGVSQFATTLFNALFYGGYDIIERQPHSYWFPRYPMGHEATLSYPKPDVVFRNDTQAGMLFDTRYTPTSVTVRIFGDNGGRKVEAKVSARQNIVQPTLEILPNPELPVDEERTTQAGMIGWSVTVARVLRLADGTSKEERRKVTYRPKARRVEVHPCRVPEGEKGYTGERCPEPEAEEAEAAASP